MTELFNQIDQGVYDWAIFAGLLIMALFLALPDRREERNDAGKNR